MTPSRQPKPMIVIKKPKAIRYKPVMIAGFERVGPHRIPAECMFEHWEIAADFSLIGVFNQALTGFLSELGFNGQWLEEFTYAVMERLTNACQHSPPQTVLRGLLIIVGQGDGRFCSVVIDQDLPSSIIKLPNPCRKYDFGKHVDDTRGRGYEIMKRQLDGLVEVVHPGRTIQAALEKTNVGNHNGHESFPPIVEGQLAKRLADLQR